jgi:hypothetical protein
MSELSEGDDSEIILTRATPQGDYNKMRKKTVSLTGRGYFGVFFDCKNMVWFCIKCSRMCSLLHSKEEIWMKTGCQPFVVNVSGHSNTGIQVTRY